MRVHLVKMAIIGILLISCFINCAPVRFGSFSEGQLFSLGDPELPAPPSPPTTNLVAPPSPTSKAYNDCLAKTNILPKTDTQESVTEMGNYNPFPGSPSADQFVNGFNLDRITILGSKFSHYFWIPSTLNFVSFFGTATGGSSPSLYIMNSSLTTANASNFVPNKMIIRISDVYAENIVICGFNIGVLTRVGHPIRGKIANLSIFGNFGVSSGGTVGLEGLDYANVSVEGDVYNLSASNSIVEIHGDFVAGQIGIAGIKKSKVKLHGNLPKVSGMLDSTIEIYEGTVDLIDSAGNSGINHIYLNGGSYKQKTGSAPIVLHTCDKDGNNCVVENI